MDAVILGRTASTPRTLLILRKPAHSQNHRKSREQSDIPIWSAISPYSTALTPRKLNQLYSPPQNIKEKTQMRVLSTALSPQRTDNTKDIKPHSSGKASGCRSWTGVSVPEIHVQISWSPDADIGTRPTCKKQRLQTASILPISAYSVTDESQLSMSGTLLPGV